MKLSPLKRVVLTKHDQTQSFTAIGEGEDVSTQLLRLETFTTYNGKTTKKKFDMDKFRSLRSMMQWLEQTVFTKQQEGYIVDVEYCFSRDAARQHDETLGHTLYPESPVSDSDWFPRPSEGAYEVAKMGDYAVYSKVGNPNPKVDEKRRISLEIRGQWVYVVGRYNQLWLGNKLSYYVEGSKFSKAAKDVCIACNHQVIKYYCARCNASSRAGKVHFKCGYELVRNWCRHCGEVVTAKPRWNGKISLLDRKNHRFPLGLYAEAVRFLLRTGYAVRRVDTRPYPEPDPDREIMVHGLSIHDRPYQVKAVQTMLKKRRGLVNIATNGGKTAISAAFMYKLNKPTVFLVSGKELLTQQQRNLQRLLGEKVGLIGTPMNGRRQWDPKKFTVASVNTLARALKGKDKQKAIIFLNSVDCIIVDEAHHAPSDTFYKVIMACPAYWRFGLSGTALDRGDRKNIKTIACFGKVIVKVSNAYLIKNGFSMKPQVSMIDIPKEAFKMPKTEPETWHNVLRYGIIENEYRNKAAALAIERYHEAGLSILVLVNWESHSKHIIKHLDPSVPHVAIHAAHELRDQAAHDFKKGKLPVLFSTPLFDEGIDIEGIDAIVLAGGGKSVIKLLQRLGRGMRLKKREVANGVESPVFYVTDFSDGHHPMLAKHAIERLGVYKSQKVFSLVRRTIEE